jgi:hypothetical protein
VNSALPLKGDGDAWFRYDLDVERDARSLSENPNSVGQASVSVVVDGIDAPRGVAASCSGSTDLDLSDDRGYDEGVRGKGPGGAK